MSVFGARAAAAHGSHVGLVPRPRGVQACACAESAQRKRRSAPRVGVAKFNQQRPWDMICGPTLWTGVAESTFLNLILLFPVAPPLEPSRAGRARRPAPDRCCKICWALGETAARSNKHQSRADGHPTATQLPTTPRGKDQTSPRTPTSVTSRATEHMGHLSMLLSSHTWRQTLCAMSASFPDQQLCSLVAVHTKVILKRNLTWQAQSGVGPTMNLTNGSLGQKPVFSWLAPRTPPLQLPQASRSCLLL